MVSVERRENDRGRMGGIEMRRLAPSEDLAAVARVYARSWRHAYRGIVPQDYLDRLSEGFWQQSLAQDVERTFVASEGSEVIGVCTYGPARVEAFSGWGEVVSLYVLPKRVGCGIGSRLLDAALAALAAEGFGDAYLWVLADNAPARAFYERRDFQLLERENVVEIDGERLREACYGKALN